MTGNGDGTFAFGPFSSVPGSVPGGITSIADLNLDGDGVPDLVASDGGSQKVFALTGDGDGGST